MKKIIVDFFKDYKGGNLSALAMFGTFFGFAVGFVVALLLWFSTSHNSIGVLIVCIAIVSLFFFRASLISGAKRIIEYLRRTATVYPSEQFIYNLVFPNVQFTLNLLRDSSEVFKSLLAVKQPMMGNEMEFLTPSASIRVKWCEGVPVYQMAFLKRSVTVLDRTTLAAEVPLQREIFTKNVEQGISPMANVPLFFNGFPTLYLLDIEDAGKEILFNFVWVCNKTSAEYVRCYGVSSVDLNIKEDDI